MKKPINFYTREVYGTRLEYVCDFCDADRLHFLTGKKTINPTIRNTIEELTGHAVSFIEVIRPT